MDKLNKENKELLEKKADRKAYDMMVLKLAAVQQDLMKATSERDQFAADLAVMQHRLGALEELVERPTKKRKITSEQGSSASDSETPDAASEEDSPNQYDYDDSFIDDHSAAPATTEDSSYNAPLDNQLDVPVIVIDD